MLEEELSGTAVARLGLAVNQVYRTKDGEKKEDVCFVDVEVWARQAETCNEYLKKGRAVLVEGTLKLDTWTDRESGQKRSKHKVRARRVHRPAGLRSPWPPRLESTAG